MDSRQAIDIYLKLLDRRANGADIPDHIFAFAEENFIATIKSYLDSSNTSYGYQALTHMGVSEDVLRKAGVENHALQAAEKDFIAYAKPYLDQQKITYAQLIQVGIPPHVLEQTGIYPSEVEAPD